MKAVILAAGQSTRIRTITNSPKCLLRIGDRAILDNQLQTLVDQGVEQIAIVVGYRSQEIVRHVSTHYPNVDVCFIRNPRYLTTNNIYSLLLAKDWIGQSKFACLNADVLYHPRILAPALQTSAQVSMIVDPEFRNETMKVIVRDNRIVEMRKGIPQEYSSGTYIGVTTFADSICKRLFATIDEMVGNGREKEFFNIAVQHLADEGVAVSYTSTNGLPWAEVDDPADYRFAKQIFAQFAATTLTYADQKLSCEVPL